jgi:hypothetical protein
VEHDSSGRPFWIGSVSLDIGAGISRLTAQITHHIDPDVDAERDHLINELLETGQVRKNFMIKGVGPVEDGRNAEGDRYFTDGMLSVAVLVETVLRDTTSSGSYR